MIDLEVCLHATGTANFPLNYRISTTTANRLTILSETLVEINRFMDILALSSHYSPVLTKKRPLHKFLPPLPHRRVGCRCTKALQSDSWKDSQSFIVELGFESPEAEDLLYEAFGWGSQKYWHKKKVNEDPDPNIVSTESVPYMSCLYRLKKI